MYPVSLPRNIGSPLDEVTPYWAQILPRAGGLLWTFFPDKYSKDLHYAPSKVFRVYT
jgi:hypothetical protein